MKQRIFASGIITLTVMASLAAVPAMADSKNDKGPFGYGYRPGWGFGDKNHVHTGPPGLIKQFGNDEFNDVNDSGRRDFTPPGHVKNGKSADDSDEITGSVFIVSSDDEDDDDRNDAKSRGKGKKKGW